MTCENGYDELSLTQFNFSNEECKPVTKIDPSKWLVADDKVEQQTIDETTFYQSNNV